MSTVLVVGGAGYIGSHAAKVLAAAGHSPVVFDNLSTGHKWAVKWGPFERGDIRDFDRLTEVFDTHKPDAVFHFAAMAEVGESMQIPLAYYDNNVVGTVTLLRAMKRAGCHNFVFSSTCATFGAPETIPIHEDLPQNPINPYGRSKLMIEQVLGDAEKEFPLNSVVLRYFNAAGADPAGQIGEAHDPESHLIPLVLGCALGQRDVIQIFGDDYPTADGTCVRDYIHVDDLADAHILALEWLKNGKQSENFNLGVGQGASVAEVIEACRSVTGHEIPALIKTRRPGDPPTLVAAAQKAHDVLGWSPKRSDLSTIVTDAWGWAQKYATHGQG